MEGNRLTGHLGIAGNDVGRVATKYSGRSKDDLAIVSLSSKFVNPEMQSRIVNGIGNVVHINGVGSKWHSERMPAGTILGLRESIREGRTVGSEADRDVVRLVIDNLNAVCMTAAYNVRRVETGR